MSTDIHNAPDAPEVTENGTSEPTRSNPGVWDPKRPFGWALPEAPAEPTPKERLLRPAFRRNKTEPAKTTPASPAQISNSATVSAPVRSVVGSALPRVSASDRDQFGYYAALLFFFLRFSFLHDYITIHIGFNSYLLTLAGILAYVGLLRSDTWRSASQSKLFWAWVWFTALLVIGVPLSAWPGGSFALAEPFVKDNFICLPLIAGLFYNWERLRRLFLTIALAGVTVTAISVLSGAPDANGRLSLYFTSTIGNPNDLAAHLIYVSIFMLIAAFSLTRNMVWRALFLGSTGVALVQILRTGSRGALLGLLCSAVVAFLAGSMKTRSSLLFLAPIAGLVLLNFVPQSTVDRLSTFSGGNAEEAKESYGARRYLLDKSIHITLEHPIFGVGPGQFSSFEGAEADAEGHHHSNWQETHNTFTEVSSEIGIPALICVLWGVGGSFVLFWRLSKQARKDAALRQYAMPAYLLVAGVAGICGALFFVNFAYRLYLVVLTGIGIAVQRAISSEPGQAPHPNAPATAGAPGLTPSRTSRRRSTFGFARKP